MKDADPNPSSESFGFGAWFFGFNEWGPLQTGDLSNTCPQYRPLPRKKQNAPFPYSQPLIIGLLYDSIYLDLTLSTFENGTWPCL